MEGKYYKLFYKKQLLFENCFAARFANKSAVHNFIVTMANRFWNRQIDHLERAGNDDFLLILTGGASAYATHELHHLLRRLRIESMRLGELRRTIFRLGVCIPAMLFTACGAGLLGWHPVVYGTLAALAFLAVVLVMATRYVSGRFSCHDRSKRLRHIIQQELERRRKGVGGPVDWPPRAR